MNTFAPVASFTIYADGRTEKTARPTTVVDHAARQRAAAIRAAGPVVPDTTRPDADALRAIRLATKRVAAIAALGDRWILHPAYVFNPRHSFRSDVWKQVPGVLDQIRARALAAGRL